MIDHANLYAFSMMQDFLSRRDLAAWKEFAERTRKTTLPLYENVKGDVLAAMEKTIIRPRDIAHAMVVQSKQNYEKTKDEGMLILAATICVVCYDLFIERLEERAIPIELVTPIETQSEGH